YCEIISAAASPKKHLICGDVPRHLTAYCEIISAAASPKKHLICGDVPRHLTAYCEIISRLAKFPKAEFTRCK
ncbi:MAG: hypothetical protein J6A18_02435, partial [Alistipes sp.]|nr:hypothetical protein [Alistipes sp.]